MSDVYDSVADTYVYFVGRGLDLLRRDGRLGMVLPNKWLRADYGEKMRAWLTKRHQPIELARLDHRGPL
ncbi:MAG TPA: Eco57I restriction-modification methylase domain-containing protein [Dehalococcoidia bacterium]|nr:Eco57I restriction-modification methylase domain-containing protein [Dehalococcoidia bacterium]